MALLLDENLPDVSSYHSSRMDEFGITDATIIIGVHFQLRMLARNTKFMYPL
jgi:hypothetical protein